MKEWRPCSISSRASLLRSEGAGLPGFRPRFFVPTQTPSALSDPAVGASGGWLGVAPGAGADLPGAISDAADVRPDGSGTGVEPGADLLGTEVTLSDSDSHHALRVLRLAAGDGCEVVVGPPFTRPRWSPLCIR